jgi:hypothetical protein
MHNRTESLTLQYNNDNTIIRDIREETIREHRESIRDSI